MTFKIIYQEKKKNLKLLTKFNLDFDDDFDFNF